jgi:sec-independent protein translocase protein TatC
MLKIGDIDETQAPLLDHLVELRTRLVRAVFALGAAFFVCLYFADDIFGFLVRPLTEAFPPGQGKLIYTKLYEAFFVNVKVALFAGFFVSFPVIANQLWAFIAPGLYAKEKKAFLPFLIATPVLFTSGGALAYYVVMPHRLPLDARLSGRARRFEARSASRDQRLSQPRHAVHPRFRHLLPAAGADAAARARRDCQPCPADPVAALCDCRDHGGCCPDHAA